MDTRWKPVGYPLDTVGYPLDTVGYLLDTRWIPVGCPLDTQGGCGGIYPAYYLAYERKLSFARGCRLAFTVRQHERPCRHPMRFCCCSSCCFLFKTGRARGGCQGASGSSDRQSNLRRVTFFLYQFMCLLCFLSFSYFLQNGSSNSSQNGVHF